MTQVQVPELMTEQELRDHLWNYHAVYINDVPDGDRKSLDDCHADQHEWGSFTHTHALISPAVDQGWDWST